MFLFISDVVLFHVDLPFHISEEFTIRRADARLIKLIRSRLDALGTFVNRDVKILYEFDWERKERLSEQDWRYFVIESDEAGDTNDIILAAALLLLKNPLSWHLGFLEGGGTVSGLSSTLNFYNEFSAGEVRIVSKDDLNSASKHLRLVMQASDRLGAPYFSLLEFFQLRTLSSRSDFQILGAFSVIESLLTHNPNDKEIGDSLTHQLKTKLKLLEKFFERPLDFSVFGVNNADEKGKKQIWGKLYEYRSYIAHGNRFEFKKDFKVLKSRDVALSFLREVTKLVLIVALEKPEFVEDLKAV
jgi:hypothetical protein